MVITEEDIQTGMKMLEDDANARKLRKDKAIANRKEHEVRFTEMIIEALESGSPLGKWTSGHNAENVLGGFPINFKTNTHYRGVNVLMLYFTAMNNGWSSKWGTWKQWYNAIDSQMNQMFKGMDKEFWPTTTDEIMSSAGAPSPVVFFKPVKGKKKDKATGKLTNDDAWIPMMRFFEVYNRTQLNIPDYILARLGMLENVKDLPLDEREAACQQVIDDYCSRTGVTIQYQGTQSYNNDRGGTDGKGLVVVPERKFFESPAVFWAHIFHEIVHSTGHAQRLNRPKASTWSDWTDEDYENDDFWEQLNRDETYAREELVAELGAGMLCMMFGFDYDTRHASYLQSWLKALNNDTSLIMKMATASQKAIDLILGTQYDNKEDKPDDN